MSKILDRVRVSFPSDLDYIPAIRKFVSDVTVINRFPRRFAFRTEVIIDEVCSNAVIHGSQELESKVGVECMIYEDRVELFVDNTLGDKEKVEQLAKKITEDLETDSGPGRKDGRGLKIVKILSNKVDLMDKETESTRVHVVKFREDKPSPELATEEQS